MANAKDTAHVIAPPPLIYLGFLLAGYLVNLALPLPFVEWPWNQVIGWPCTILAVAWAIAGVRVMRSAGTDVNPYKPTKALVIAGPFRYSRNPLYISLTLFYVGVAVLLKLLWPILFLPLLFAIMHFGVITREERYLERILGEEYRQYKATVRRWI